jgi:hypothetical protein
MGDFKMFLNKLESIIYYLYKLKAEFVICSDISMHYLAESYQKQCLNSVLTSFNLMPTVNFPQEFIITPVLPLTIFS